MLDRPWRRRLLVAVGVATIAGWFATYSLNVGDFETVEVVVSALELGFAVGVTVLVLRLDLPVLELGFAVVTYSALVRFLDSVAEGPELLETLGPNLLFVAGFAVVFAGLYRSTRELRSKLGRRDERLDVLNRVLRHNLRTDVNVITGAFDLATARIDDESTVEHVEDGKRRAKGLAATGDKARAIDETLQRAEETGEETVDVAAIAERVVGACREEYPDATVDLSVPDGATASAVPGVERVVRELVENACKHAGDAPTVSVTVERRGDAVVLRVEDDGPGIPDQELEPIRTGTESSLAHASGLGLWLVKWVAEDSGGELSFDSDDGQVVTLSFRAA